MDRTTAGDPWEVLHGLPMGRRVTITSPSGQTWTGTIVPHTELSGERVVQLKLPSGYNAGLRVDPAYRIDVFPEERDLDRREQGVTSPPDPTSPHPGGRWVALLTTGGTIASRVDYQTGGVRPVRDEREILQFYPDLNQDGPVRVISVFDKLSEDIVPADWVTLAERIVATFREGARGIVVAHGTDTLAFTASALSFLLSNLPGPVVLVGAQRSPDRPSSDGASNLHAAVRLARAGEFGEVVVLMHAGLSDDRFAIHRATRVRKMHSSRRDAFQSRNAPPLGFVGPDTITWNEPVRPSHPNGLAVEGPLSGDAGLLWFYPGLRPEQGVAFVRGLRGLVVAGTGLGHVASAHFPWMREAVESGTVVVMTTQCLEGLADPFVYATGRELLRAGVLYVDDLLPETAYTKLLWALGRSKNPAEVRALMLRDRVGEFVRRHVVEGTS
ncbi:MAG: Glu-tRNA(Gln) amidotransferase subunit GatD [Thermoplasmata archaeon]